MTAMSWRRIVAAALLCASHGVFAHSFNFGITDISVNARSGNTEIVHTYMLHDIEARLAALHQRPLDLSRAADEALLRSYVEQQFFIESPARVRLPLRWIGISATTDSLVIYQEISGAPMTAMSLINDAMLLDFLPQQTNTVNIRVKGQQKSLLFDRSLSRQLLR